MDCFVDERFPANIEKVCEEPSVHLVRIPFQNVVTDETNIYVIQDGDDVLIVDMGAPTDEAAFVFLEAMTALGIDLRHARFFFTHLHFDHAGLVGKLVPEGATIYINKNAFRAASIDFERKMGSFVKNRLEEEGMDTHMASEISAPISISTVIDSSRFDLIYVGEGDEIRVGERTFHVVDLPGHTRGMQGLFDPTSKIMFSGDQLLFVITPSVGIFLDGQDSFAAYDRSLQKLLDLPISELFISHGEIRKDFRSRAMSIRESRRRRFERTVDVVKTLKSEMNGMFPNGVDIIKRMGWKIPFSDISECEPRQQWLIYTQGIAILDHLVNEGWLVRMEEAATKGNALRLNRYCSPEDSGWGCDDAFA